MHLVQILLPLARDNGEPTGDDVLRRIKDELTERFGGLTAYSRAPAEGVWQNSEGKAKDDVIIVEVMAENLDRNWWDVFRKRLETVLSQKEVVVRSHEIERL